MYTVFSCTHIPMYSEVDIVLHRVFFSQISELNQYSSSRLLPIHAEKTTPL